MKYLSILLSIGMLFLCLNSTYANDCDGTGDCNVRNICINIDLSDCNDDFEYELSKDVVIHPTVRFKIPPLVLPNDCDYTITAFEMDFDDGQGWQSFPFLTNPNSSGTVGSVLYSTEGEKRIKMRVFMKPNGGTNSDWSYSTEI